MKTIIRGTLLSSLLFAGVALAQTPAPATGDATPPVKAKSAQQQKMSDCNKQATGKKGDERKTFMSSCLKGEAAAAPAETDKQAACEAAAKSKDGKPLSGAAKTSSVKACLKKAG